MVLQAQQARRGALAAAKVAGREDRDAGGGGAEQEQEDTRQRVAPHVERQVGQSDRERRAVRRCRQRSARHDRQRHAAERAERKQGSPDEDDALRTQEARDPNEAPQTDEQQAGGK